MYEKFDNCPSCAHPKFENFLICTDHSVSGESFALVKCANCNLIFTNPRPKPEELSKYYESKAYISHTDKANSLINLVYKIVRNFTLRSKTKLIRKYSNVGTVLDLGCGTGDFLKACKNKGWTTSGVELNETARRIAIEKTNSHIATNLSDISKGEKFDIITAWHVLEHVSDLKETIKQLKKRLVKGGHLIIAVPNIDSLDAKKYKQTWAALDVPRHLYHFSRSSFTTLAKKNLLKLVDIHPMKFDAYYVSLLSEKYKTGSMNPLPAFINGTNSNKSAKKTGDYSSLIYILTK